MTTPSIRAPRPPAPPTRSCATRCTAPHRGVVVDSPPGAGKSTLVVRAARELAAAGRPLMVIAQTNAQVDDLVLRLAEKDPDLPVGRLHSSDPDPYDKALDDLPNVRKSAKAADLAGLDVVISTAAKWAHVKDVEPWRHAIVDEAYQMRSDALLAVAGLFERALFVGDPGQLDPFAIVGSGAVGGAVVRPVGLARSRPCWPTTRSCRSTGCRCPGGCRPRPRRWSPTRSTRTRRSAAARATATGGSPSLSRRTARARTVSSTRRPSRAGACWSCPPGTRPVRTPRRCARSRRSYGGCWTGAARRPPSGPTSRYR